MEPNLNQFSGSEKDKYQQKLKAIVEKIENYDSSLNKGDDYPTKLADAINALNIFFVKGKKVWFDQYRLVIQKYFLVNGFGGVNGKILIDFFSFWSELTSSEQSYVSRLNDQEYALVNFEQKHPKTIIESIIVDFQSVCKLLKYKVNFQQTGSVNDLHIFIPDLSEKSIFVISANLIGVKIKKNSDIVSSERVSLENYLFKIVADICKAKTA